MQAWLEVTTTGSVVDNLFDICGEDEVLYSILVVPSGYVFNVGLAGEIRLLGIYSNSRSWVLLG